MHGNRSLIIALLLIVGSQFLAIFLGPDRRMVEESNQLPRWQGRRPTVVHLVPENSSPDGSVSVRLPELVIPHPEVALELGQMPESRVEVELDELSWISTEASSTEFATLLEGL